MQTFKKLCEGTPTEVAVKNKGSVKVMRIPMFVTANYPFWKDGGALEKQAFASRMIEYKFGQAAGFLKLAKRALNPCIWKELFAPYIFPDVHDEASSGDDELVDFLNVACPEKKRKLVVEDVVVDDDDDLTQEEMLLIAEDEKSM